MAGEWREMPFSQAVAVNPQIPLKRGGDYPFVDMKAVNADSRCAYASESRSFVGGGSRFAAGDTLLARITPCLENGKIARFCAPSTDAIAHGSTEFIVIRGRQGITETDYAFYLTKWESVSGYAISQMTGTSGRQRVPTEALDHLVVPVPPLSEQRAIAHILGTLDDKIEMNRRMNETLEAMVRAIFKSWFVDFDPVRAKLERRDPDLPKPIADFFPDRLEDSELGEIPAGWEVKTIEAIAKRVGMGPFGSSIKVDTFVPEGVPVISGQHLRGFMMEDNTFNFVTPEHAERLKNANVGRGDVVFTHAGNIGQVAYIPENSRYDRYVISQRQFFMRCDLTQVTPNFVTFYFRSPEGQHRLLANASSSGVPSIAQPVTYLRSIQLTIPPKPIMDTFEKLVQPLLTKFRYNMNEVGTLTALRDTLLPKLISGELRVKDAERITEGHA